MQIGIIQVRITDTNMRNTNCHTSWSENSSDLLFHLKTSSSDLGNECRLAFGFRQFAPVIADRKKCFNLKYISSINTVCKAVSAWTLN